MFFTAKKSVFWSLSLILLLNFGLQAESQVKNVNYKILFANKNLSFDSIPKSWDEAPYFGNGFIGSMVYRDTNKTNVLKIQLFRTDVHDHRSDSSGWTAYARPRLLIGFLNIAFKGKILKGNFKQNLYTADLTAQIETTKGTVNLHHFVQANKDLILTQVICKGEERYKLSFEPAEAKTTRTINFPNTLENIKKYADAYGDKYFDILKIYKPNPKPDLSIKEEVNLSTQNLLAGGSFTVAWKQQKISKAKSIISVTIQNSYPQKHSVVNALTVLNGFDKSNLKTAFEQHKNWWANFYHKSFMSIPDKNLEKCTTCNCIKLAAQVGQTDQLWIHLDLGFKQRPGHILPGI
nr:hypothetical protein [uncultured Pedobacter sp.]